VARIRSIKPEFWHDRKMARELTREQRLFYIALWNHADDEGRFDASTRVVLSATFPHDPDIHESLTEASLRALADTGRVVLYEVNGEQYGFLPKLLDHQRINRPTPSRIPPPPNDLQDPHAWLSEPSVRPQEIPSSGTGELGAGEQGSRGAEEFGTHFVRTADDGKKVSRPISPAKVAATLPVEHLPHDSELASQGERMRADELVALWIDGGHGKHVPKAAIGKQGAAAKRICEKFTKSEIITAVSGISRLFPHSNGTPWDLFVLERKFTLASAAPQVEGVDISGAPSPEDVAAYQGRQWYEE
jgi:hypothetical protein